MPLGILDAYAVKVNQAGAEMHRIRSRVICVGEIDF